MIGTQLFPQVADSGNPGAVWKYQELVMRQIFA